MAESEKDTREFIMSVANNLFARYGFSKTTMNDIAEAAGKAKSSLYHYFQGKEQVFQAILDKEYNMLKREIEHAISLEDTPHMKLKTFFVTRMRVLKNIANFYSAIKDEYLEHYSFIEKLRENYNREEMELIKSILELGIRDNSFSISDLDTCAMGLFLTMKGTESFIILEPDKNKNEKILESIMETVFFGINKR